MREAATLEKPWFARWPPDLPRSLTYPDVPVQDLLRRTAGQHGDRPAVTFYGKTLTYRDLDAAVDRFAAGLRTIGVRAGDRVSLLLPNTPHFMVAFFAVLRAGAIVVQTNPILTPRELEVLWNDAGVTTVVALDLFWHSLSKAKAGTQVQRVVVCDAAEFLRTPLRQLYPIKKKKDLQKAGHWPLSIPREPWIHRFADLAKTSGGSTQTPTNPDEVAVLQYTGGTTGTPKGAMLTHRNLVANAVQCAAWFVTGAQGPERVLGAIPLFHVYGLTAVMLLSIVKGGEVILYPNPRDIGAILKLIHKTKPSLFPGVPTMYIAILRHPNLAKYDLRSVRVCVSGAAPLPNEVRKQFEAATGGRIVEGYGLTEASPVTHCNPINGIVKECIGIPFPDTDAKLVDPEDASREVPPGEIGELAVRGPQVMKGYWNHPDETAAVLRNGWLLTGDIAKMDADGYFTIVDRKKDIIKTSGFLVFPAEVEEVLNKFPGVAEAAVIGVPHPERGEDIVAIVVPRPSVVLDKAAIEHHCQQHLGKQKRPRQIEIVSELPKNFLGKIQRRRLRESHNQPAPEKAKS